MPPLTIAKKFYHHPVLLKTYHIKDDHIHTYPPQQKIVMGNYQGIYQYIKKRTISYPKKLRVNIVLQRSVSNWNWYKKKDMETITYVQDM